MSQSDGMTEIELKNHEKDPVILQNFEESNSSEEENDSSNCCKKLFSQNIKDLLKQIFHLSWAVILGNLFTFLVYTQSLIFCGQLGASELAAGTLSNTMIVIFGNSIGLGMTTALDTLCAQAYGAKNYRLVGIILQRGILILAIAVILVWSLWMLAQHFLLLIGFDTQMAQMTDTFMMTMLPMVPAEYLAQLLIKYLQSQGIVKPLVVIGAVNNVFALGLFFFMVKYLQQGFRGVAIALMLVSYVRMTLLLLYIKIRKLHEKTWEGWSVECLYGWKQFLSHSFPGLIMICLDWWTFEIGSFVLGSFGETVVATYGIMMQLTMLAFMVPYGISISASVLVGNFLGANDPHQAKTAFKLCMAVGLTCTGVVLILSITCRKYIAMIFSDNVDVINLFVTSIPMIAFFFLQDCVQGICSGVIHGCGRQKVGMIINFISHDVLAIPLGIIFAHVLNQQLLGVWWGIGIGVFVQALSYVLYLSCTSWKREARLAVRRTSQIRRSKKMSESNNAKDQLIESEKDCEKENDQNKPSCDDGGKNGLLHQQDDQPTVNIESPTNKRKVTGKLILTRAVPFIISILILCATVSIRLFVPLPAVKAIAIPTNSTIAVNGTLTD